MQLFIVLSWVHVFFTDVTIQVYWCFVQFPLIHGILSDYSTFPSRLKYTKRSQIMCYLSGYWQYTADDIKAT